MGIQSPTVTEPAVSLPRLDLTIPAHRSAQQLSVDHAAIRFGISRATLHRMIERGDVPCWLDERGHRTLLLEASKLALRNLKRKK